MKRDRGAIMAMICERISAGQSLRQICEDEQMPSRSTVQLWLLEDKRLSDQYAHAREAQADFYADEIIDIADKATDANLARLRVDARKWAASKLAPKKYGDKVDLNHTGTMRHELIENVIVDPAHPDR